LNITHTVQVINQIYLTLVNLQKWFVKVAIVLWMRSKKQDLGCIFWTWD